METITIDIINPKARKLINDLADMELIAINDSKQKFKDYLNKMRSSVENPPSLEEITAVVEEVRSERYGLSK
jgi:hypothetical protein